MDTSKMASSSVLSAKHSSGPVGLGDPSDRSLRKVEREVMIPKLVREMARAEKCAAAKADFDACCLENGMSMVVRCRGENTRFQECMNQWFHNEDFVSAATEQYLEQRAEFRRTGVKKNPMMEKLKKTGKNEPSNV